MKGKALIKVAAFLLMTLSTLACTQDTSFISKQETKVIVDSYVQPNQLEELDVLVGLDTSGSMSDNYEDVASGMDLLRIDIESLTLDYQFGYITMDPTELGYVGPYDSSSSAIDMMMAPSLLPTTIWEEGFASTYRFLTSEEGAEFRRPDADFLLFLISDEDEQSAISADLFYDWLQDEFSHVRYDVVTISHVEDSDCPAVWGYGYKYIELSALYGKDTIDICQNDWSVWLSDSSYLTQLRDWLVLSEPEPILSSIIVYVDGEAIYDWTYLEETNTIQLGFVPGYGSFIEVGYNVYVE